MELQKTDNIRLPSSGVNTEAGAMMKQSTVGNTQLDQTFHMTDKAKPSLLTGLKVCYCRIKFKRMQD